MVRKVAYVLLALVAAILVAATDPGNGSRSNTRSDVNTTLRLALSDSPESPGPRELPEMPQVPNPPGPPELPSQPVPSVQPVPSGQPAPSVHPRPSASGVHPALPEARVHPTPQETGVHPTPPGPSVHPTPPGPSVHPRPQEASMPPSHLTPELVSWLRQDIKEHAARAAKRRYMDLSAFFPLPPMPVRFQDLPKPNGPPGDVWRELAQQHAPSQFHTHPPPPQSASSARHPTPPPSTVYRSWLDAMTGAERQKPPAMSFGAGTSQPPHPYAARGHRQLFTMSQSAGPSHPLRPQIAAGHGQPNAQIPVARPKRAQFEAAAAAAAAEIRKARAMRNAAGPSQPDPRAAAGVGQPP
ncbi:hypothetical protein FA10DRAFT_304115, partial [Acaromyces ingoldii]